jgi:hypothetical protein
MAVEAAPRPTAGKDASEDEILEGTESPETFAIPASPAVRPRGRIRLATADSTPVLSGEKLVDLTFD